MAVSRGMNDKAHISQTSPIISQNLPFTADYQPIPTGNETPYSRLPTAYESGVANSLPEPLVLPSPLPSVSSLDSHSFQGHPRAQETSTNSVQPYQFLPPPDTPLHSVAQLDLIPKEAHSTVADMFAAMAAKLTGGRGNGGMALVQAQQALNALKMAPVLNPHYGMVIKYLDCLNRLIEPLVLVQGPQMGVRSWLIEVQTFCQRIQKRAYSGMPLLPNERQAIQSFAAYWRQMVGLPYNMGRPEAQVVLITLTEFAMR